MRFLENNLFYPPALLLLLCASIPLSAAEQRHEQKVNDLAYGSSLYNLFLDKTLAAITDLTAAKERAALKNNPGNAELLLAGLYFDYGLPNEARKIFKHLLNENISAADRDRVWFNLARVQYEKNNFTLAEALLHRIDEKLPAQREAEKLYILTNLHIQNHDFERAKETASLIQAEHIWRAYSEYNLGIALTAANHIQEGHEWLNRLSSRFTDNEEFLSLQDSARLALALSSLRQNQLDKAIEYFGKIRVTGPLSNKALLGAGWAWSRKSDPKKALTYWQALANKNQADNASLEAHLAIAYAFEQTGNKALSAQYYDRAAQRYEQLLLEMDQHIEGVEQMDLINTLYRKGIIQPGTDKSFSSSMPDYRATPYIHQMIASKSFQQAIQNYQELYEILNSLSRWKSNFPVLELMLKERRNTFENKRPLVQQTASFGQLKNLQQQRDALAEEVHKIKASQDSLKLANEDEADYLEQLEDIKTLLSRLEGKRDTSEEHEKYRLLHGLLYWDISTDYPRRYWRLEHQLQLLDRALTQAESSAGSLLQASDINDKKLLDFSQRIKGQDKEIQRLKTTVTALIKQQEQQINQLAIHAIESRKQQLIQFRLNARYSLARVYDEISKQGLAQ